MIHTNDDFYIYESIESNSLNKNENMIYNRINNGNSVTIEIYKFIFLTFLLFLTIVILLSNSKAEINELNKEIYKKDRLIEKSKHILDFLTKDDDDNDIISTSFSSIIWSNKNCSLSNLAESIKGTLSNSEYFNAEMCKLVEFNETINDNYEIECKKFTFYNTVDTLILLNRSNIHAVGDSVTRRLFNQLRAFLLGMPFKDYPRHSYLDLTVKLNYSSVNIYFHWAPSSENKIETLKEITATISAGDAVFVGQPNHDFAYENGNPRKFYQSLNRFNKTITNLNSLGAYVVLDGILNFDESRNITYELKAASMFYDSLYRKQNLFAYIDMWTWIQLVKNKTCVERDYTGIHFVNDDIRLLHLQAFLNYIHFFQKFSRKLF